jgi:hypothetical protein
MIEQLGTYKGAEVFKLTKKEYIKHEYYDNEDSYWVITDDRLVGGQYPMVYQNEIVAILDKNMSTVEPCRARVYYTGYAPTRKEEEERSKPVEPTTAFDVDEYLKSKHSVDIYLAEMEAKDYVEHDIAVTR